LSEPGVAVTCGFGPWAEAGGAGAAELWAVPAELLGGAPWPPPDELWATPLAEPPALE
jgi:hypothetical protein